MFFEVGGNAFFPREGGRQEIERLLQTVVRLGTTKPQESTARFAEALAAQAGDAEFVVGPLEQIHGQAVDW